MKTTSKLTLTEILELIEVARNAEISRDISGLREALETVCDDVEQPPEYDFEEAVNAELYRLHGVYASFFGLFQSLKHWQIKSKNFLTRAIDLFEETGSHEKAAEAKINLSFCYLNLDETDNADALLNLVEAEFGHNPLNHVCLQLQINKLLICQYRRHIKEGLRIVKEISEPMSFCGDFRLQAMFHNQAGILFRADRQYEKAIFHLNEAIRYSVKAKNYVYVGANLNNLAYLFKEAQKYDAALEKANAAIKQFRAIKHYGYLAHTLDTKALICLDSGHVAEALRAIDAALDIFRRGEDYRGLTEALWNKIRIHFALERHEESLEIYAELYRTAEENISPEAAQDFARRFTALVYFPRGKTLWEQESDFRRSRVSAALCRAKGKLTSAARILGLPSHETLSYMLDNQFPELRKEFGCEKKNRRRSASAKPERTAIIKPENIYDEAVVRRVRLPNKNFTFSFNARADFETFYFDCSICRRFGLEEGAIVAVIPLERLEAGRRVVAVEQDKFLFGVVEHDALTGLYFIEGAGGEWIPVGDDNLLGEAVGYCPLSGAESEFIDFKKLV